MNNSVCALLPLYPSATKVPHLAQSGVRYDSTFAYPAKSLKLQTDLLDLSSRKARFDGQDVITAMSTGQGGQH
uniref:hypothetical protein n=1 Tax=Orrella marina TaxID=2163011 RepID=UPI001D130C35|nr:hypothetical protein [Orrella marina]